MSTRIFSHTLSRPQSRTSFSAFMVRTHEGGEAKEKHDSESLFPPPYYLLLALLLSTAHPSLSNGNRTEWSPIRSVIIRVITKSDDRVAGGQFLYHEYDYRPNWKTRSLKFPFLNTKSCYQRIIKITIFLERRVAKL